MDRAIAKLISADIEAALQPVAETHGLQIKSKGGRFDDTTYTAKIECSEISNGVAQTPKRREFISMCDAFGLKPEQLDATFKVRGETYRITGLAPSRQRYPVIAERVSDGKSYKMAADTVVEALAE